MIIFQVKVLKFSGFSIKGYESYEQIKNISSISLKLCLQDKKKCEYYPKLRLMLSSGSD